jgi:hypothetical protein
MRANCCQKIKHDFNQLLLKKLRTNHKITGHISSKILSFFVQEVGSLYFIIALIVGNRHLSLNKIGCLQCITSYTHFVVI